LHQSFKKSKVTVTSVQRTLRCYFIVWLLQIIIMHFPFLKEENTLKVLSTKNG
jgi:hypothetical protein